MCNYNFYRWCHDQFNKNTDGDSGESDDDFDKAFQPLIIDSNVFFVALGEPTESEKQVIQAKSNISDSFDYSHEFQMTKHMIFGNIGNLTDHSHQKWAIIKIILNK